MGPDSKSKDANIGSLLKNTHEQMIITLRVLLPRRIMQGLVSLLFYVYNQSFVIMMVVFIWL